MIQLVSRTDYTFTLSDLKLYLSIGHSELDVVINAQVPVAVNIIESELGIACRAVSWRYITDKLTDEPLPYLPIASITNVKVYVDGTLTTVNSSNYRLLDTGKFEWITYPTSIDAREDAIQITYVQSTSPYTAEIKRAIYAITELLLDNRAQGEIQLYGTASYFVLERILNSLKAVVYV